MIRDAREADRDAIAALQTASWRDVYAGALPPAFLRDGLAAGMAEKWRGRAFGPPLLVLVEEAGDGALAGFVCCLTDRDPPYVDNLHVDPGLRSRGTGSRLMGACFARLRGLGHDACALTVWDRNARARAFYARLGGTEGAARPADLMGHPVREVPVAFRL